MISACSSALASPSGAGIAVHQVCEQVGDTLAGLRADRSHALDVKADDLFDLRGDAFGFRLRQIDLVEHRQHLQPLLDRRVAIRDGLRLYTLSRVDHQKRTFARGQRTRHLVAEVDVTRRIDEVQLVGARRPDAGTASVTLCALMVIPRSRSRSMESSTCSAISRSARPPHVWMKRSASVDLP